MRPCNTPGSFCNKTQSGNPARSPIPQKENHSDILYASADAARHRHGILFSPEFTESGKTRRLPLKSPFKRRQKRNVPGKRGPTSPVCRGAFPTVDPEPEKMTENGQKRHRQMQPPTNTPARPPSGRPPFPSRPTKGPRRVCIRPDRRHRLRRKMSKPVRDETRPVFLRILKVTMPSTAFRCHKNPRLGRIPGKESRMNPDIPTPQRTPPPTFRRVCDKECDTAYSVSGNVEEIRFESPVIRTFPLSCRTGKKRAAVRNRSTGRLSHMHRPRPPPRSR